jgi:hypothetical protein
MRLLTILAVFGLGAFALADDKKADDKAKPKAVAALPPNPLDGAFKGANSVKEIDEGLLNNAHYQKAVKEALKAKQDREAAIKKNPKMVGPTPEQAARVRFLAVLNGEKDKEPAEKK